MKRTSSRTISSHPKYVTQTKNPKGMITDAKIADMEPERDYIDELNACPLVFPTTEEVGILREFMKETFPDRFVAEQLYHFTRLDVVEKLFMDDADLWCTHYRFQNDSMEWRIGLECISGYLRAQGLEDLADEVESLPEKAGCAPWITSFSQYNDKASMWGMYGDSKIGGCALGFKRSMLEGLIAARSMVDTYEYYLLPCLYTGVHDVGVVLGHILNECHSDEDEHLCREGCGHELSSRILSRIFFLSLLMKHSSFDYENEWRLVIRRRYIRPWNDNQLILLYDKEGNTKPHIESKLFDRPLREYFSHIIISPCGDAEDNYRRLEELRQRYNLKFLLERSQSPYNGR